MSDPFAAIVEALAPAVDPISTEQPICIAQCLRNAMLYRRYERPDGTRFATYEVPESVVNAIGHGQIRRALEMAQRGRERRAAAEHRRAAVRRGLAKGKTASEIAKAAGVTEARVRQIRAELRGEA